VVVEGLTPILAVEAEQEDLAVAALEVVATT
jgi:hypothetical protein